MELFIGPSLRKDELDSKISAILTKLKHQLKGRVLEAYIFGSMATNKFHEDSDLDLILIVNTKENFLQRNHHFFDLYDIYSPIDLLIYTPSEFQQQLNRTQSGFWSEVKANMKQII
jgi:predicted nucleotidyltransferase